MNNNTPVYPVKFLLGIGVIPVILLFSGISDLWNAQKSAFWPSVEGRVIETQTYSGGRKFSEKRVHVLYEYQVGDIIYKGDRLSYSQTYQKQTSFIESKFYKNAGVTVYFDQTSPSNSVLMPGYEKNVDDFSIIIGTGFMVSMIALLGWFNHKEKIMRRIMR
jgi:hypothetical protein